MAAEFACRRPQVLNLNLRARVADRAERRCTMGKAFILWLLGVPFTLLVVLWLFGVLR